MTSRRWCVSAAAVVLALTTGRLPQGQGATLVDHVNPRPAAAVCARRIRPVRGRDDGRPAERVRSPRPPKSTERGAGSLERARSAAREPGTRRARAARPRRRPRDRRISATRATALSRLLDRHAYVQFTDSHDLVTEGSRWVQAMALAHDWLYPYWTADERAAIEQWLATELTHWVDTNRLTPRVGVARSATMRRAGCSALVLGALTLYDVPGAVRRRPAGARVRAAVLRRHHRGARVRGSRRRDGGRHVLRQLHRLRADAHRRGALHRRRRTGRVHALSVLRGAPAVRHPRELAGLPDEPVRLQRAPARAGLRRCAAWAHRFGPLPPRHRPAARQALPEHAGGPRGVLGGEPRRDVPALHSRVVALRRAVLVSRRAADASVGARVSGSRRSDRSSRGPTGRTMPPG